MREDDPLRPRRSFFRRDAEDWEVKAVLILVAVTLPLLSLFGVSMVWDDYRALNRYRPTTGRITATRIDEATEEYKPRDSTFTRTRSVFRPQAEYEYSVQGQAYRGQVWATEDVESLTQREAAQARLQAFPVGAEVPVRFDPEQPAVSVHREGYRPGGFVLAVLFGALTAALGLWVRRRIREEHAPDESTTPRRRGGRRGS